MSVAANDTWSWLELDLPPDGHDQPELRGDISTWSRRSAPCAPRWAIDPDGGPNLVDVIVDGVHAARILADIDRLDVAAAYPLLGGRAGFDLTVPVSPGPHIAAG